MNSKVKEPDSAPPPEQWFPLTLGSTFREPSSSTRFYSLRYEFKPASIDTTRPGSLFKSTDNKVTVDFCNNQVGKPKVSFQGNSEDCKELDGIIFFDGKSFRLERLHRAVKSLRHMRLPGESSATANSISSSNALSAAGTSAADHAPSPGNLNGGAVGLASNVSVEKITPLVQVEEIPLGNIEVSAEKKPNKRKAELKIMKGRISPAAPSPVVDAKVSNEVLPDASEVDGKEQKLKSAEAPQTEVNIEEEEHESDYEIEDVDVSEDDDGVNAAEALRAQASVAEKQQSSSDSSGSSGSGSSSGSESGSSSSGSDGSDDDEESASLGDDI